MSLRKVTSLGSNLASVTDLKRIQTPHSLCCDFGGDQAAEFKFQVWAPAVLGPLSGSACAGRTGEHKHRAFPSRRQSLRAATGSLEENMLPLLQYWLSSRANKVLMLCKFRGATNHFFFNAKWKKIYQSKVCVQEFSYFVSVLDIQVEKSESYSTYNSSWKIWIWVFKHTVLYAEKSVAAGEIWRVIQSCEWGLENPLCRPLFKSNFENSRINSGQELLQF